MLLPPEAAALSKPEARWNQKEHSGEKSGKSTAAQVAYFNKVILCQLCNVELRHRTQLPRKSDSFKPFLTLKSPRRRNRNTEGAFSDKVSETKGLPCAASSGLAKDCGASGAHHNCLGVAEHSGDPVEENCHLTKHNSDPWEKDNTL